MKLQKRLARIGLLLSIFGSSTSDVHAIDLNEFLGSRLDPNLRYETIKTPHFEVHYPEHLRELASRLSRQAEETHRGVVRILGVESSPLETTHLVVHERADVPSVFTFVTPIPEIYLDAAIPSQSTGINDYRGIHEWYLNHEYAHMAHLQMRGGIYKGLSSLFGSWVRPQVTMPFWLKEGLSIYLETTLGGKGRGESSTYRMMMRSAHSEGLLGDSDFAHKDTVFSSENKKWPWGMRPYLFGYYLVRTLSQGKSGGLPAMLRDQSSAFPFEFGSGLEEAGFHSFDDLWKTTLEAVSKESKAEINLLKRRPFTPIEYLTQTGQLYYGLTISPDGKQLFVTRDHPDYENAILSFSLDGDLRKEPRVVTTRSTGYQTSFSRSGYYIAFDQSSKSAGYYQISDISILDLRTGKLATVSPTLRARDPDIHPDGKQLVYVMNVQGKNRLISSNTGWGDPVDLLGDVGYRRISTPRISPDGKRVVFQLHNETTGGEDLAITDYFGKKQFLIQDGSQNRSPSWAPDGNSIYYSSDRSGVFNIYRYDLRTKTSIRLTHVLGGVFEPVVDPRGRWMLVTSYRGMGYDVARIQARELRVWEKIPQPDRPWIVTESRTLPTDKPVSYTYSGTSHLSPKYLAPSIKLRPGTAQLGFSTTAVDPLYFQNYDLALRYDTSTKLAVGEFSYLNSSNPTAIEVGAEYDAQKVEGYLNPFKVFASKFALHFPLDPVADQIYVGPEFVFQSLSLVGNSKDIGLGVGARFDSEFREIGHTFPEYGTSISVKSHRWFPLAKGDDGATSARLTLRTHYSLPWPRHALHLGLQGAAYLAARPGENRAFTVGSQASFPYDLSSSISLQGTAVNAFAATRAGVGTLLYTFSLADIQRGLGASPFFFGRTSVGLQAQAASLPRADLRADGLPASYGGSVYQNFFIGHIFEYQAQLGVFRGTAAIGGETRILFSLSSVKL